MLVPVMVKMVKGGTKMILYNIIPLRDFIEKPLPSVRVCISMELQYKQE